MGKGFSFYIAAFDSVEWDTTIAEAEEGPRREIAITRKMLHEIADGYSEVLVTAESLGWLSLWVKIFEALRACEAGWAYHSGVTLDFVLRHHFEVQSDLFTIAGPRKEAWDTKDVQARLRGYTAWSLLTDIEITKEFLKERNLRNTFELNTRRSLIKGLGESRDEYEKIHGELEDISDSENRLDLERYRSRWERQQDELRELLEALNLEEWSKTFKKQMSSGRSVTFKSMIDPHERTISVRKYLQDSDIPFYTAMYGKLSIVLHGGSMFGGALDKHETSIYPRLRDRDEENDAAIHLARSMRVDVPLLSLLRKYFC